MEGNTMEIVLVVLGILLALSEGLALIPSLASNSVFQLIVNIIKKLAEILKPKK